MLFARVARVLVVLTALCACSGRGDPNGPLLPTIDLSSTSVGLPYEVRLTASGGVPPLHYSIGAVPDGFSFYSGTALLTGPATAEGEFSLTVGVTDATGATDSRTYSLRVYAAPAITSMTLPEATSGLAYEFLLSAMGGQPPLRWTLVDGSLPPGMTLSTDGHLSGVPRGQGGYPLTVRVQDGNGALTTRQLTLQVRSATTDGGTQDGGTQDGGTQDAGVPFLVGNWNVEWFGDGTIGHGPADEQLQFDNVRAVIADAGVDFLALEEIVDAGTFALLKQSLPGYDGFLANDTSRVSSGTSYYTSAEQKPGVLFKADALSVTNAEVILTGNNSDFAGRPPLRLDLRITRNGISVDMVAIVVHLKASTDTASYDERVRAAGALKTYLDTTLPTARVIVLGDWNDDVDKSIANDSMGNPLPTPFQNFLDAPAEYTFVTQPLSLTVGSTVSYPSFIDHQMITNELVSNHVSDSTTVLRPSIPSYGTTTSDHYPILSRFSF